jgi:hypothetical protein
MNKVIIPPLSIFSLLLLEIRKGTSLSKLIGEEYDLNHINLLYYLPISRTRTRGKVFFSIDINHFHLSDGEFISYIIDLLNEDNYLDYLLSINDLEVDTSSNDWLK